MSPNENCGTECALAKFVVLLLSSLLSHFLISSIAKSSRSGSRNLSVSSAIAVLRNFAC